MIRKRILNESGHPLIDNLILQNINIINFVQNINLYKMTDAVI